MSADRSYDAAVRELNGLQTNAAVLDAQRRSGGKDLEQQLPEMHAQMTRAGIQLEDLDRLRVIHVTGSKGKGSTCAFTESILRHHGRKTGLFTSPHLIEVRERIRIDGAPLPRDRFAEYFWQVWDRLRAGPGAMPPYFRFTTIMAFHVFLREGVDVAVLEVGIGGRFDATNIVPRPVVCAVSALALEHTALLGNTLPQIAYHKGGIIKTGAPAFTAPQPPEPTATLLQCATSAQTRLLQAPPLSAYPTAEPVRLGLAGSHQEYNASLAIQLSQYWLSFAAGPRLPLHPNPILESAHVFPLSLETVAGLRATRWPGRCQIVEVDGMTLLVDGAHTLESCTACAEWCETVAKERGPSRLVLLFNCMGDRDPQRLLQPFVGLHASTRHFAAVHFCPNRLRQPVGDLTNNMVSVEAVMSGPRANEAAWARELDERKGPHVATAVHPSVEDAIDAIRAEASKAPSQRTLVLVTGSLHLVGAVLTALRCPVE